jgi:seryl-tRNA synthetase
MIEIQIIRQSPELVKQKLSVKNFSDLHLVDEILQADEERRAIQKQLDDIRSRENAIAKEIGVLFKEGKKDEAEAKKVGNIEFERGKRYINEPLCRNGKKTIRFVSATTEPSVRFGAERKNS